MKHLDRWRRWFQCQIVGHDFSQMAVIKGKATCGRCGETWVSRSW